MRDALNGMAAIFLILLLLAEQLFPASPLFWAASTATALTTLRYALVFILLWFIVRPPRTKWLRIPLGLAAVGLCMWLADAVNASTIGFIDFLALATAVSALLATLLETKPEDEEFQTLQFGAAMLGILVDRARLAVARVIQLSWLLLTDLDLAAAGYLHQISSSGNGNYAPSHTNHGL